MSLWRTFLWPDWAQRKRLLRREAWLAIVAAYLALGFAWLWPQDFRNTSPAYVLFAWAAMLLRVLQYHIALTLLLIAAIAAMARTWRMVAAALPLAMLILAITHWPGGSPRPSPGPGLRVMSANLLMINRDTAGIIEEVRRENPDVLLLQEYAPHWHDALQAAIGADYPYISYVRRDDSFGTAIYSRRPFVGKVKQDLLLGQATVPQMRAVVEIEGRQVALYNIHLLPPRTLSYTTDHRLQFADLLDVLRDEKLPFALTGDFNFTETTPQAAALRRAHITDAQDTVGTGRGATWPVNSFLRYVPGIRLDHVYLSPQVRCRELRLGTGRGSDHRPLTADLVVSQSQPG